MQMNQRNSRSFIGAQSAELRESWQRGPNENTNCLLRQYFSARIDFLRCSRVHPNKAAHHLNERPRKALEFETRRSGVTAVLRRPVEITLLSDIAENEAYFSYSPVIGIVMTREYPRFPVDA